jgi:hypothetical protein
MSEGRLILLEAGREMKFSYADLMLYHGFSRPAGVAHAFKVMQLTLPLLSPDGGLLERREVRIRTAFNGAGAQDAFEMVTRATSENRYAVDLSLKRADRGSFLARYVFVLNYRGKTVAAQIKSGHVRDEFIALRGKPELSDEEESRVTWLRKEMASRLVASPASEIYEII